METRQLGPGDPALPAVLGLIRRAFAGMEGRIDPPSSMHRLTVEALGEAARTGELWVTGDPPVACVLLAVQGDALYLSKLAVDEALRGRGLARQLVELAGTRAAALGLAGLELNTRVELVENHAAFARLGFQKTGDFTHPGYHRPTSVLMRKVIPSRAVPG
jgi:GNAT superfamily N-acetyltransferase